MMDEKQAEKAYVERINIIDREVKGVTARNLLWFQGGVLSILISIIGSYFAIVHKIDSYNNGLNIITNTVNMNTNKIETNSNDIKAMENHTLPSLDTRMSIMEEKMKDKVFIKNVN